MSPLIEGLIQSVKTWQTIAEIEQRNMPGLPDITLRQLRIRLLQEEWEEYITAENADDIVEIADALADMMYIIVGTALCYGIPLEAVMQAVCHSNDAKFVDGKVRKRADGKIIKPEGWTPPDIAALF